jgi:hypothetical protein
MYINVVKVMFAKSKEENNYLFQRHNVPLIYLTQQEMCCFKNNYFSYKMKTEKNNSFTYKVET